MGRILRWFSIVRFVNESQEFKNAWDFQKSYNPESGLDYRWVADHSVEEFKRLSRDVDSLDEKADSLIRYLGAGSGFISLGTLLAKEQSVTPLFPILVPTLCFLLVALCLAVIARKPQFYPAPPYTREAFDFVDFFKDNSAQIRFSAKVGAASVAMKLANEFKAVHIRWAFRFFVYGIVYLVSATIYFRFLAH